MQNLLKVLFLISVTIFIDQTTKFFATRFLQITYNRGISFGLLSQMANSPTLITLGPVAVFFLLAFLAGKRKSEAEELSLTLILSGALSNILDRILNNGRVIDWIRIWHFPTFNLADVAISVGFLLMLYDIYKSYS